MRRKLLAFLCILTLCVSCLTACDFIDGLLSGLEGGGDTAPSYVSLDEIPAFDGKNQSVIINGNVPFFNDEKRDTTYESFSELDALGRCGVAIACIGIDLMPTEEREEISHVKPSGWHSVQYDIVPGKNLYNRAHLIGFQLTGENDNEKNLITGTRDMNNEGMLPLENKVASYVKANPENKVLYRVSPIYDGNNLVASGVLMEALSVGDGGEGIQFCVYVYNAQAGVVIDYKTGESRLADDPLTDLVNSNHDNAEILPSEIPESVDAIYEETADGEFSGCLVIVAVKGYKGNIILAVDISEDGKVIEVYTVSESETHGLDLSDFTAQFDGKDYEGISDTLLVSGATETTRAVRDGVRDALLAFKCYTDAVQNGKIFIANISSKRFHTEDCSGAKSMSEKNKLVYKGYAEDLVDAGFVPCGTCNPAN